MLWRRPLQDCSTPRHSPAFLRAGCLQALIVGLAILPLSCEGYAHLTRVTSEFPRAAECGKCHVEIYEEWAGSPHAGAWVHPRFRASTDDYSFAGCLGCHAPEPTLTLEAPAARKVMREEGVTCVSCHLEESKQWGPVEASGLLTPHPVGVDRERYTDSRFCGRCHEGTLREWQAAEPLERTEKPSCQQCHMPEVTRKITQATDTISSLIVAFEDEHTLKRHTFVRVPEGVEPPPISCELVRSGDGWLLRLHNALPHSLPPGDFGVRVVTVEARAVSGSAESPQPLLGRWELVRELGTHVPAGGSRDWPLEPPTGARAVRVLVVRSGSEGAETAELLHVEVPIP